MKRLNLFILMITLELSICVPILQAETFGGIEFPNGAVSFADEVIDYNNIYSGGLALVKVLVWEEEGKSN